MSDRADSGRYEPRQSQSGADSNHKTQHKQVQVVAMSFLKLYKLNFHIKWRKSNLFFKVIDS